MLAALILVANQLSSRSGEEVARAGAGLALSAVTSETPVGVAFQFGTMIETARAEAAERIAARQEAVRERQRRRAALERKFADLPGSVSRATLESIAECESGGDPEIISSNGLYHGKYQFHPDTWESVGGKGLPSDAPETEQDYRAALLYERSGPGQWPVCGQ